MITRETLQKQHNQIIWKGWGFEYFIHNGQGYCGKFLVFNEIGSKTSEHIHLSKDENFFCLSGMFDIEITNTSFGTKTIQTLKEGDSLRVKPMTPHRIVALVKDAILLEVSTEDSIHDSYRLSPGDSQK